MPPDNPAAPPGPAPSAGPPGPVPSVPRRPPEPVLTVSIWHNVTRDTRGRRSGPAGFAPGDEMVRVFAYDVPADGRDPAAVAEDAYAACNDAPRDQAAAALAARYRQRRLRSLTVGDMVVIGEAALTVAPAGFALLAGRFTPVSRDEHGTHPIP